MTSEPDIVDRLYRLDADHCGVINAFGEAAREITRLRERLGPVGLEVVEIDGAGHYVNAKVKAEIERLRAEMGALIEKCAKVADQVAEGDAVRPAAVAIARHIAGAIRSLKKEEASR